MISANSNSSPTASGNLLDVHDLCKYFPIFSKGLVPKRIGEIRAVDNISFSVRKGETLGIVGESGSGKTTAARSILRALTPTSGQVWFDSDLFGRIDLSQLSEKALKPLRREMQMVFQDPFSSLNPRMTVGDIVGEPLVIHGMGSRAERRDLVASMLEKVGMKAIHMQRYPHAFSGGQRQRIGIARALIMRPKLIVADEAVSALDVSVQAQVINLLQDLQDEFGVTYLFVAHDLSVVRHICDRVAVMYLGKVVEFGPTEAIFSNPRHPYTKALLSAIPQPDPDVPLRPEAMGEIGDLNRFAGMDMTPVFHPE
ncbi:MAG: ATP-binding cassette domain-containing protein [Verrucomicrobia bacterium]|nr:ATP-binding cassette domain-containing protein [Verrucomicrobiota bacterium]